MSNLLKKIVLTGLVISSLGSSNIQAEDLFKFKFEKTTEKYPKIQRGEFYSDFQNYEAGIKEGIKEQILNPQKEWSIKNIEEFTRNEPLAFQKGFELSFRENLDINWAYFSIFVDGFNASKLENESLDNALKKAISSGLFINREDFVNVYKAGFEEGLKKGSIFAFENIKNQIKTPLFESSDSFEDYVEGFKQAFNSEKSKVNSAIAFHQSSMQRFKKGKFYSSAFKSGFDDGLYSKKESLDYLSAFSLGLDLSKKFNDLDKAFENSGLNKDLFEIFKIAFETADSSANSISIFQKQWEKSGLQNGEYVYFDKDGSKIVRYFHSSSNN